MYTTNHQCMYNEQYSKELGLREVGINKFKFSSTWNLLFKEFILYSNRLQWRDHESETAIDDLFLMSYRKNNHQLGVHVCIHRACKIKRYSDLFVVLVYPSSFAVTIEDSIGKGGLPLWR